MLSDPAGRLALIAAVYVALYCAHVVADHWVQTQWQADNKDRPGWVGRIACLSHVATYTATGLVALVLLANVSGWRPASLPVLAGLAVNAVTHYIADRRWPLRWLADRLRKNPDWLTSGGGLYLLDQSWHVGFLFLSALLIAL